MHPDPRPVQLRPATPRPTAALAGRRPSLAGLPLAGVLLACFASPAAALEPGPFTVQSWDESFYDEEAWTVFLKVHYPAVSEDWGADADPSQGPYPVLALIHGAFGQSWMYDEAGDHLASHGFVVLNLNTEVGPWIDTDRLAQDAFASLHWLEGASADPEHWLAGMADDGDWTAMGHSMGGVAMARLIGLEPRVTTLVGFMPYEPGGDEASNFTDWPGAVLQLGGSEDDTSEPAMLQDWFAAMDEPSRGLYLSIEGAGHQAITTFEAGSESMPDAQQRDVVLELATAFVQDRVFGDEQALHALTCELPAPLVDHRSNTRDVVSTAVALSETSVQVGAAGWGGEVVVYAGRGPGSSDTAHGAIDLRDAVEIGRFDIPDGVGCRDWALPAELGGLAWLQLAFDVGGDVRTGRTVDVFGVGDPGPAGDDDDSAEGDDDDSTEGDDDDSAEGDDDDSAGANAGDGGADPPVGSGCSCDGSGAAWLLPGVLPLGRRRRRVAGRTQPSEGPRGVPYL